MVVKQSGIPLSILQSSVINFTFGLIGRILAVSCKLPASASILPLESHPAGLKVIQNYFK